MINFFLSARRVFPLAVFFLFFSPLLKAQETKKEATIQYSTLLEAVKKLNKEKGVYFLFSDSSLRTSTF